MPDKSTSPLSTAAERINAKTPFGRALSSAQIKRMPAEFHQRSLFSANVGSAKFLSAMKRELVKAADTLRAGGREKFIAHMQASAKRMGVKTDGAKGGMQDIRSVARLGMIYDTQLAQANGYARWKATTDRDSVAQFPALMFTRVEQRMVPRKNWPQRWAAAGDSVGWDGAKKSPRVATKDSPIWAALSRWLTPWPPFDYNSGMGQVEIDAKDAARLRLPRSASVPADRRFNDDYTEDVSDVDDAIAQRLAARSGIRIEGGSARME